MRLVGQVKWDLPVKCFGIRWSSKVGLIGQVRGISQMHVRHVTRVYQIWKTKQEQHGRTVIPGQPLYTAEDRRRMVAECEQRHRTRLAAQQRQDEQAREREIFGDRAVDRVSIRLVPLD